MSPIRTLCFALGTSIAMVCSARAAEPQAKTIAIDLTRINDSARWTLFNATAEPDAGQRSVRLVATADSATGQAGLAVAKDVPFSTGTIEVKLRGKNVRQKSFLGVAFNIADEKTFEAVYFRPFNFEGPGESKGRAVQYIAWPEFTWKKLRNEKPGVFEAPVAAPVAPNDWFSAKVEVTEQTVTVYVNGATTPSLRVQRLVNHRATHAVGLFVDVDDGHFADLRVTPSAN